MYIVVAGGRSGYNPRLVLQSTKRLKLEGDVL
jgi:hypothetical protein